MPFANASLRRKHPGTMHTTLVGSSVESIRGKKIGVFLGGPSFPKMHLNLPLYYIHYNMMRCNVPLPGTALGKALHVLCSGARPLPRLSLHLHEALVRSVHTPGCLGLGLGFRVWV